MPRTKKTTKRTTRTVRTAPAKTMVKAAAPETHEVHCGCKCTPLKKAMYLGGMFILGLAVAKFAFCPCPHHHQMKMNRMHPVFVNGCLDMESIKCPKMQEELATADTDANGCISEEEFRAAKHEMRREMREGKRPEAPAEVIAE